MLNNEVTPATPNRLARRAAQFGHAVRVGALAAPFIVAEAFAQTTPPTLSGLDYGGFVGGARSELNASLTSGAPTLFALAGTFAAVGYMLRKVFGIG